jgi:hypothetical protein
VALSAQLEVLVGVVLAEHPANTPMAAALSMINALAFFMGQNQRL